MDASLSSSLPAPSFPLCFPYKVLQPRLWSQEEAPYSTWVSMDKSHIPLSLSTHLPIPGLRIINHSVLPTSDCRGNKVPTTQPGPHPQQTGGHCPQAPPFHSFILYYIYYGASRRRQWHPTPVLLPGKSHGWGSLVGCSPWGRKESDTTERLHFHFSLSCIGEGNGNPLQCSCLENPRVRGAWRAAVSGVAQSRTRLKRLSSSSSMGLPWWLRW